MNPRILLFLFLLIPSVFFGQDDLFDLMGDEAPSKVFSLATFKGNRIINGHSVENPSHGELVFIVSHRFGRVNSGFTEFFGLDQANIRLNLEYGITDRLTVGVGRSSNPKVYDSFIKYQLLKQAKGPKSSPVTMVLFASGAIDASKWNDINAEHRNFSHRMAYSYSALIARKFSKKLSLQLSPLYVHKNLVSSSTMSNGVFSMGFGGRYMLTNRLGLVAEYYWLVPGQNVPDINGNTPRSSLSVGVDLETGGHVFQFHLSNSLAVFERGFATETTGRWEKGDIHFGFNVSRNFTVWNPGKQKRNREDKKKKGHKK